MRNIILDNNFCIDCGHLHYTPYWFEQPDKDLVVWRSYLCEGCGEKRLLNIKKTIVQCFFCNYVSTNMEEVVEHSQKCQGREGESYD